MNLLQIAENAASEANSVAKRFLYDSQVISSEFKDIKTIADLEMNDCIVQILGQSGIPVITEETVCTTREIPVTCWIIDPLDGTYNFTRKFPCSGISIALWENGTPVMGVIKDIFSDCFYKGETGKGSWIDGNRMKVSDITEIKDAILATGFPSGASYDTEDLMRFVRNVQAFKKIRAIGSASIMLAHVSNGIFDVYYEKDIYIWDVAAGLALVKNAGGEFSMIRNGDTFKYEILATNANIFENAKALLMNAK